MQRQSIFKTLINQKTIEVPGAKNLGGDFGNSNFRKKGSKFFKKLLMSFHNLFPAFDGWKQTFFNTENISFRCDGN